VIRNNLVFGLLLSFLTQFVNIAIAQDDMTPPPGFEFNQSRYQSFYVFEQGDIDGASLSEGDWIATFKGDVCVGSWPWTGEYTQLPAMGDDGSSWTEGYLLEGEYPSFKVYDASANTIYVATPSANYSFIDFGAWILSSISVLDDCNGDLGGIAFLDDCGTCAGGNSGHIINSDQDCLGSCFGDAYVNGCGDCVIAEADTCNVDCTGSIIPEDCSDNTIDGCAYFDDCGVCSGGTSNHDENSDADCLGVCFGDAVYDECGICDGNDSSCNQPVANYQTVSTDEDNSVTITVSGVDPNEDPITYNLGSSPENGSLSGSLPNVVYTPTLNFNGTDSFTFTVSDGTWTSVVGVVTINVLSVNDAPVLTFIENELVDEDNDFVLAMSADDVDEDDLVFNASIDGNADVFIDGNYLTISPNQDFNGDILVDVTVTDGDLSDTQTFTLTVSPINDAMIFLPVSNQTTFEDTPLTFDLDITDIDGPFLVLNYEHTGNVEISFVSNSITTLSILS